MGVALDGATDSEDHLEALLGKSEQGRTRLVESAIGNRLALVEGDWKYIEPSDGPAMVPWGPVIETGFSSEPQLYDLSSDPGELRNLASERPEVTAELARALEEIKAAGSGWAVGTHPVETDGRREK